MQRLPSVQNKYITRNLHFLHFRTHNCIPTAYTFSHHFPKCQPEGSWSAQLRFGLSPLIDTLETSAPSSISRCLICTFTPRSPVFFPQPILSIYQEITIKYVSINDCCGFVGKRLGGEDTISNLEDFRQRLVGDGRNRKLPSGDFCATGSQGREGSFEGRSDSLETRNSGEAGWDGVGRGEQTGHFLPRLLAVGMEHKSLLIKTGTIWYESEGTQTWEVF